MKLSILLIFVATIDASRFKSVFAKSEICTFQNCNSCEIVLENKHIKKIGRAIPACKNLMQNCCQKFKCCDVLLECIPRFLQYYRSFQ